MVGPYKPKLAKILYMRIK